MADFVGASIDQGIYSLYEQVATLLWIVVKAFLLAAYFLMELSAWVTGSVLSPLIDTTFNITSGMLGPIVLIATLLLAIGYFLSVWGDFKVVEFKSGFMWLLISIFIFTVGPSFYEGIENFRRGLGAMFYEEGITQVSAAQSSIGGIDNFDSDDSIYMEPVVNYLGIYGFSSTDQWIDGIDVVFAFTQSDGCDLFRATSCGPQSAIWASCFAISLHECLLPTKWYAGSEPYFANTHPATGFPYMTSEERQAAIADASKGLMVVATSIPMAIFALIEQVINFLLALSMGVAYLSMGIAVLFSFFKKTEPITWSVFNLIIELFIQSIMSSIYLSLIVTLLIVAAGIGNGILVIGTSLVGIVLLSVLLAAAWNALWSAINRMFGAMSTIAGNNMPQVTKVAGDMTGAVTGTAGAVGAGAAVMMRGGSVSQAVGVAMSDNQGFVNAARNASYLFDEDSPIGGMASEAYQGAAAGGLFGKGIGAMILPVGEDANSSQKGKGRYFDEDGNPYSRGGGGGGNDDGGNDNSDDQGPSTPKNKKIQTSGRVSGAAPEDENGSVNAHYWDAQTEQGYLGRNQLPAAFRLDAVDDVEFKDGMMPSNLHGGSMINRDDLQSFKTKDGIQYDASSDAPVGVDVANPQEMQRLRPWREKQQDFNQSAAGFNAYMGVTQGRLNAIDAEEESSSPRISAPVSTSDDSTEDAPRPRSRFAASYVFSGGDPLSAFDSPAMPTYMEDAPDFDESYSAASSFEPPDYGDYDYDEPSASSFEPPANLPPYGPSVGDQMSMMDAVNDGETRTEVTQALAGINLNSGAAGDFDLSALTSAISSLVRADMPSLAAGTPMEAFATQASAMGLSDSTAKQVVTDIANNGEIATDTRFAVFQDVSNAAAQSGQPVAPSAAFSSVSALEAAGQQMVSSLQNTSSKISSVNPSPAPAAPMASSSVAAPSPVVAPVIGAPSLDAPSLSGSSNVSIGSPQQ